MKTQYLINGTEIPVQLAAEDVYGVGSDEVLSTKFDDITKHTDWYDAGYTTLKADDFYDPAAIYTETTAAIMQIVTELRPEIDLNGFTLERYHAYVDDALHGEVIKRSRRLFPADLGFDSAKIVKNFSTYLGVDLSFTNPQTNTDVWMIARINKPKSHNYNTVHKDIYEAFDQHGSVPKMVNIWIPVCGVNDCSGLPMAPGSHLLPESKITRTKAGSTMNAQRYSVASILDWGGNTALVRENPKPDEFLIFSSHLIHGLALNNNEDETRVSFEFRLYEKL
ncbi:phytanoyl-CoA dioxygenase [Epibacterium sp. Ofav1-8]|uniref:phytanoyl-CoA dioxygenase n=1 Tax=Epibacterium sp. Ofav1-8 TaxID=2917735 RepID=UPI001EF661F6|nr:phytanoyl-CoA dioxygenase [Epibacterium sp. Ofav1-8]